MKFHIWNESNAESVGHVPVYGYEPKSHSSSRPSVGDIFIALLPPDWKWSDLISGSLFNKTDTGRFSIFMFFAHHVDYWLARRSFRKSLYGDEDIVIEFSDAGFHARSAKQDIKLQWSAFTRVARFKEGFLLFQSPKLCNWIPLFICIRHGNSV